MVPHAEQGVTIRGQAHLFVRKPFAPKRIVDMVNDVLSSSPAAALPITVVSARPEWVELVAPCSLEVAERVQDFVMQLDAKLPDEVRESVAQAFRELLINAVEWGASTRRARCALRACARDGCCCTASRIPAKGSTSRVSRAASEVLPPRRLHLR